MNNEQLIFGNYAAPTEKVKEHETRMKNRAIDLLDAIDRAPISTDQKAAAKRDIVTGLMWAVKCLHVERNESEEES